MTCSKPQLRHQFLHQRRSLAIDLWQAQSELLCDRLSNCPQFIAAQTILAYQSCRQEPSLDYLFAHTDKQWGLPRCVDGLPIWHRWQTSAELFTGSYGIREPNPKAPLLLPGEIDLILVPAVAIDRQGYRLGYGGGYYDRLRADPVWRKIPTIGIVFDFAYVDRLPIDPWDLPLDAVCTELGVTTSRGNS
ncbi:5-formyltetrahydrofolate cyclo-ligase [Chamaesiphon sp. VAR_69_metabat_338]|uniref:5-formyltetrahydrofolate cyclo-ligase n=1 Tax=Chamaesiphon sp. VAR_69_metabat_338 TaxID=2964704 RepID=UPI00286E1008|nr:5-formyltetrahydrofolate cyclo-ligase [Chamaesiphon sp. VAR_69_metabat_338]